MSISISNMKVSVVALVEQHDCPAVHRWLVFCY